MLAEFTYHFEMLQVRLYYIEADHANGRFHDLGEIHEVMKYLSYPRQIFAITVPVAENLSP